MDDEKEKKRKKQYKRMGKILGSLWELDEGTNYFQERPPDYQENDDEYVLCLSDIGKKIDSKTYRLGRHGWEDFAKDVGGVYNFHIKISKTQSTSVAKKSLDTVRDLLEPIEKSLVKCATDHVPIESNLFGVKNNGASDEKKLGNSKKRKPADANNLPSKSNTHNERNHTKKARHSNKNSELAEREERAMEQLCDFIEELGGNRNIVAGFRSRVTKKGGASNKRRYDVVYYNEADRRFRSMQEVGRFLKLKESGSNRAPGVIRSRTRAFGKATSKEIDSEKKRIRKDLERLRKAQSRVSKSLDDFATNRTDISYPIDDRLLFEERDDSNSTTTKISTTDNNSNDNANSSAGTEKFPSPTSENGKDGKKSQNNYQMITRETCAAACVADINGFQTIPSDCIPDMLMTWDFLCTFERALSLSPISLDDFTIALGYTPPEGQTGDDVLAPPVYIAEVHLALLKLLLQDRSSDDWWWSTLESDETEQTNQVDLDEAEESGAVGEIKPIYKIDVESLLGQEEDPVATMAWMRALEHVGQKNMNWKSIKSAIKSALKLVYNRLVSAYLKKTLDIYKFQGKKVVIKAIQWLIGVFTEARPDLKGDRIVHKETIAKARNRVSEKASKEIESLADTAPTVKIEDATSDVEFEDDSDDESDDDDPPEQHRTDASHGGTDKVASIIPPKPSPTIVDLLLPPAKPKHNSDLVDAFTWPHLLGVATARYLHRRKRLLNEMDDSIRGSHFLPPLFVSERREREKMCVSRVLTECCDSSDFPTQFEKSVNHLCSGGNYLELPVVIRLCLLRILVEAAYDTGRVYEVVSGNYKQRTNATKSLEMEQRRAKKEAKEKATADESAARTQLASDARDRFIDEKREEIRALNAKSKEFNDDVIESFTEEDIIDFDEDIKADYEALPGPETFNKTDVSRMIQKMQELAAFDTDALRVLSLPELVEREKIELEEMEGQLAGFGGDEALHDGVDRETRRSIERLQRDIEKARALSGKLPDLREKAMEQLADALENGTTTVLRNAFVAAKKAKLSGVDDETGGIWAVDLMRDVALELENAKHNKRLLDAQRDLVGKLNKCFIRTEPIGYDRYGNRFWCLDTDEPGHTWREAEFIAKKSINGVAHIMAGFIDLVRNPGDLVVGTEDMEQDFITSNEQESRTLFTHFSRQEYHSSGLIPALVRASWGCYASVDSLKAVMKQLDSRGVREQQLKSRLKETMEQSATTSEKMDLNETLGDDDEHGHDHDVEARDVYKTSGDEAAFNEAKLSVDPKDEVTQTLCATGTTGINSDVRIRKVLQESKHSVTARYENGVVTGWKIRLVHSEGDVSEDMEDMDGGKDSKSNTTTLERPIWRVQTDHGRIEWLSGEELIQSMARWKKWEHGGGYFEHDSSFLGYRNNLGRFCGKATDAPYSCSPSFFAKLMMRKESELYPKLKVRSYDNSWGGQSGARALWTNSMKDYAYDFPTVRQGLLTLETAFFELTGQFSEYPNIVDDGSIDGNKLLSDGTSIYEIELESIEKGLPGLWNSPSSRGVYLAIVNRSSTTGVLALALDLLVRNTMKYLHTHKLVNARSSRSSLGATEALAYGELDDISNTRRPLRSTRRMNTWQQQQQNDDDDDDDGGDKESDEDWS